MAVFIVVGLHDDDVDSCTCLHAAQERSVPVLANAGVPVCLSSNTAGLCKSCPSMVECDRLRWMCCAHGVHGQQKENHSPVATLVSHMAPGSLSVQARRQSAISGHDAIITPH